MNRNDLVSNVELKFSDNDELATLTAIGFDAETLIICTSVGGFMDPAKKIIPLVEKVDSRILSGGDGKRAAWGRADGLQADHAVGQFPGHRASFADWKWKTPLQAWQGQWHQPKPAPNLKARQKWLASGSITFEGLDAARPGRCCSAGAR